MRRNVEDRFALKQDFPLIGCQKAESRLQCRRFSNAVGAQYRGDLPLARLDVEVA